MSLTSLLLILGSACLHVVAHIVLRGTANRDARVWWILALGSVMFAPVVFLRWQNPPPIGYVILLISGVFEVGYYFAIARAYHFADMSLVYPLARGTAPALLLIWSVLILREQPTLGGVGGIALIVLGLYIVNLPGLGAWLEPLRAVRHSGPRWALLAGFCISCYTITDRFGLQYFDPLLYTVLEVMLAAVGLLPLTLWQTGWSALKAELRLGWRGALVAGFTNIAAYAIVLYVMTLGTPASYAGAAREISVVLGTAIGVFWFKESGTWPRLLGAGLVAAGVMAIKLFG